MKEVNPWCALLWRMLLSVEVWLKQPDYDKNNEIVSCGITIIIRLKPAFCKTGKTQLNHTQIFTTCSRQQSCCWRPMVRWESRSAWQPFEKDHGYLGRAGGSQQMPNQHSLQTESPRERNANESPSAYNIRLELMSKVHKYKSKTPDLWRITSKSRNIISYPAKCQALVQQACIPPDVLVVGKREET